MSFVSKYGMKLSYECSELIEELKQDIEEFATLGKRFVDRVKINIG